MIGCVLGFAPRSEATPIVYTYSGPTFQAFVNYSCPPRCRVWGSLMLDGPLPANASDLVLQPLDFSFTDGLVTIDKATLADYLAAGNTSAGFTFDQFSTDESGALDFTKGWNVWLRLPDSLSPASNPLITFLESQNTVAGVIDQSYRYDSDGRGTVLSLGAVLDSPGNWSRIEVQPTQVGTVPEPATGLLTAIGIAMTVWLLRARSSQA